jgi:DDE superfamily endonuclease
MEDVLELYAQPYDAQRPVVCFDETNKQLIEETRLPLPALPAEKGHEGQVERYDYEYKRNGTRNLFLHCEPKRGWRQVAVTQQRTMVDFAQQMKWLVDEAYPAAEVIRIVLDNLNTHRPASLYEAFAPAEARRILRRLEFHYTPKHGSWLNMAEIELSVLNGQCLDQRIGDETRLKREVHAWQEARNAAQAKIDWRFNCQEARVKLHRLYPSTPA